MALQRAESEFVIGTVCKRILKESPDTPLWTIHDSIMTIESRSEFVKQIMEEEFAKLGVQPRLRVEGCAGEPEESAARPSRRVVVAFSEVGRDLMSDDPTTHRLHPHEHSSYGTAV